MNPPKKFHNRNIRALSKKLIKLKYKTTGKSTWELTGQIVAFSKCYIIFNVSETGYERPLKYEQILSIRKLRQPVPKKRSKNQI